MSEERIRSNDAFFQMFINQIPKEIYRAEENSDMNTKYFKHRKAPLTLDEKKILSKKRKNEKYGLNGDETGEGDETDDADMSDPEPSKSNSSKIPASFTSLSLSKSKKNKEHTNKNGASNKPHNHVPSSGGATPGAAVKHSPAPVTKSPAQTPEELHQSLLLEASQLSDVDLDIDLNDVKSNVKSGDVGKPGSKVRRLKRMLQEAEAKRQRLEALKQSGIDGQEQAQKELWVDALIDASGAKSVTDTGKLRKALKRIDKHKEKSAREWQGRLEAVEQAQSSKQERREQNLKNRKIGGPMISSRGDKDGPQSDSTKKGNDAKGQSSHKGTTGSLLKPLSSKQGGHNPGFEKKFKNRPGFEGKKKPTADRFLNSPKP